MQQDEEDDDTDNDLRTTTINYHDDDENTCKSRPGGHTPTYIRPAEKNCEKISEDQTLRASLLGDS